MSTDSCPHGVSWGTLVDYWGKGLSDADEDACERHLFSCDTCTQRLRALAGLGTAIRNWTRLGRLRGGASQTVLERLAGRLAIRRYSLEPSGRVRYSVRPEDDLIVVRLSADLKGVSRVDLEVHRSHSGETERFDDLPIVRQREVLFTDQAEMLRELPSHVATMRLLAVEDGVDRLVATYTLEGPGDEP